MPTFTTFNNRLPDPTFLVSDAGATSLTGSSGPGFATVSFKSNRPAEVSKTISGRGVHRESGSHSWEFDINYHPMLRDNFDTVSSFLDMRNGRLNPFYVVLPQNSKPKNTIFASYVSANAMTVPTAIAAGKSSMLIQAASVIQGSAKPGDFFNISDPNDVNHLKTYKVTAVETNDTYQLGSLRPVTNQLRIHFMPPLTKFVAAGSTMVWINPQFRVIQKSDIMESQLNTDNLYSFSLSVEEIMP